MTRWDVLPDKYKDQMPKKNNVKVSGDGEKEAKLVIPGELPTMNEIINISKTHWAKYKKMKDEWTGIVVLYASQQEIPAFEAVELDITYYRSNKRVDPDNLCAAKKIILDGLQEAGVLENDGWKEVKGFQEKWQVDKDNPRTEIIIKESE